MEKKKQIRKKKTKWDAEALPKLQLLQTMEKFNHATEDGGLPTVKIRIHKNLVMEIKSKKQEARSKKQEARRLK